MTKLFVTRLQGKTQFRHFVQYFFQRLASKVSNLHHLVLCLICQIFNRIDTGTFQAVIRAHRQIQFFNAHFQNFFLLAFFFFYHDRSIFRIIRQVDEQVQVFIQDLRAETYSVIGCDCSVCPNLQRQLIVVSNLTRVFSTKKFTLVTGVKILSTGSIPIG